MAGGRDTARPPPTPPYGPSWGPGHLPPPPRAGSLPNAPATQHPPLVGQQQPPAAACAGTSGGRGEERGGAAGGGTVVGDGVGGWGRAAKRPGCGANVVTPEKKSRRPPPLCLVTRPGRTGGDPPEGAGGHRICRAPARTTPHPRAVDGGGVSWINTQPWGERRGGGAGGRVGRKRGRRRRSPRRPDRLSPARPSGPPEAVPLPCGRPRRQSHRPTRPAAPVRRERSP